MLLNGNSGREHIGWGEEQRRGKEEALPISLSGFWKEGKKEGKRKKQEGPA